MMTSFEYNYQNAYCPFVKNCSCVTQIYIIKITSESDPRSYEVAITNKAQKKFWGSNGIWIHDLRITGAMLYQLSYEASLEAG